MRWRKTELDIQVVNSMVEMLVEKTACTQEERGKCRRHGLQEEEFPVAQGRGKQWLLCHLPLVTSVEERAGRLHQREGASLGEIQVSKCQRKMLSKIK